MVGADGYWDWAKVSPPPQTPLDDTTDYTQKWFPTDEKKTIWLQKCYVEGDNGESIEREEWEGWGKGMLEDRWCQTQMKGESKEEYRL